MFNIHETRKKNILSRIWSEVIARHASKIQEYQYGSKHMEKIVFFNGIKITYNTGKGDVMVEDVGNDYYTQIHNPYLLMFILESLQSDEPFHTDSNN